MKDREIGDYVEHYNANLDKFLWLYPSRRNNLSDL